MLLVGITGGLATGKSAVTRLLAERGAVTFSADQAARAVLTPCGHTLNEIARAFGPDVLRPDGTLDRARLGAQVFADAQARESLNQITHPPILRLLRAQIEACRTDLPVHAIVVVEVPLLFETEMQTWFERIVVVTASLEVQVTRLAVRNGLDEGEAQARIAAQMPLARKVESADFVIANDATPAALRRAVSRLWRDLQTICAAKA